MDRPGEPVSTDAPDAGPVGFARMTGLSIAGQEAQHAFWGQGEVERLSLLHQLRNRIAG